MVNTQVPAGAMFPQLAGAMVVPAGNAGDGLYVTLLAVEVPVLVKVIVLATPLVLSANEVTLALMVVFRLIGGATIILKLLL
jgi:hypothetical protein